MKSITVPKKFGYPSVTITINGKEQTFASGMEINVEDSVAEAIENALALAPKPGRNKSRFAQFADGSIEEITLSDLEGIETIVSYAFKDCSNLTSVVIPNSVTDIGSWAFSHCASLKSVNIPNGVKIIREGTFYNCNNLTSIEVPDNLQSIGISAYTACKGLKSVTFSKDSKIERIGANAFDWCSNLESVYLPETPPTLENINAFANINTACVFYCKTQSSLEAYKKTANWSTLTGTYSFVVET